MTKPEDLIVAQADPRWAAMVRLDALVDDVRTWDPNLLRERRVLVPVDLQALVVPQGSAEQFVRLPFALSTPDGQPPDPMPVPFADGAPRDPGVHLHWALPDALLRGEIAEVGAASANRLAMPALPDTWVVLRLVALDRAGTVHVRGWVLDATTGRAVPLEQWPAGAGDHPATGKTVAAADLTGSVGGALSWTGQYDAVRHRMAFHDPLDDLTQGALGKAHNGAATYVVAGWWSDPTGDPLDGAQTTRSVHDRLNGLGWSLVTDAEGADEGLLVAQVDAVRRATLGLPTGDRYGSGPADEVDRGGTPGRRPASPAHVFDREAIAVHNPVLFDEAASVTVAAPRWPRSTLLHGTAFGVPVDGRVVVDQRPDHGAVQVAVGAHVDDLAAALVAPALAGPEPEARRRVERVVAAFTGNLLDGIGSPDGLVDIEEHEHAGGFASFPGGSGSVDRLRPAGESPLPAGRHARPPRAGGPDGGRSDSAASPDGAVLSGLARSRLLLRATGAGALDQRALVSAWSDDAQQAAAQPPEVREVLRPAPRFHAPLEPMVAVRGPKRSLRMHHDGAASPDGLLRVRWAEQTSTGVKGVIDARALIRTLSGALPPEVLALAREAVVTDPYLTRWLARFATTGAHHDHLEAVQRRLDAEAVLRHGLSGTYDGSAPLNNENDRGRFRGLGLADDFRRHSLFDGVSVAPIGVTDWSQPWIPLWLEWAVDLDYSDRLEGWALGAVDLEAPAISHPTHRALAGRSPVQTGVAAALSAGIGAWLEGADARVGDDDDEVTERQLDDIADAMERVDVLSATLDTLHDELLGLPIGDYGVLSARAADGSVRPPVPSGPPELLVGGILRLTRARLVDAFGRVLELPVDTVRVAARHEEKVDAGSALALPPRLLRPARWLFRLVAAGDPSAASPEATIDQIDPGAMVNPVSGFLLPDHIDEALEAFDTAGRPLGELRHEAFGGGVVWEIAPGRSGPADAGPLHDLPADQHLIGHLAAAMAAVDSTVRDGRPASTGDDSALSAFLRAVDTTLWTVDSFAGLGSTHIAGLVGRPIAVVRAVLSLEIDDDLGELDLSGDGGAARAAAYAALADRAFPVRLGELTRVDDGLIGFFVDDDYRRFHVVDRLVRDEALDSGPRRGHFGRLGATPQIPPVRPIDHPYLVAEDELVVRPGQVVRLTLLMHPAGTVHLTSGILPRKSLHLARDWVHDGLARIAPSVRVGPVLIEPGDVRLPKVSAFPPKQLWTRRTAPATWRDDPIVAATQSAILPSMPAGIEEGYIRIDPAEEAGT